MSKRAEEKALEVFPNTENEYKSEFGTFHFDDINVEHREGFIVGYEQAEKDLALLIEAAKIVYEAWNGGTMDDVRREMIELGKQIMEEKK